MIKELFLRVFFWYVLDFFTLTSLLKDVSIDTTLC